jgi:hypothetical protein
VVAELLLGEGDLAVGAGFEFAKKAVSDGRGIETGRRETVEEDVAFLELQQLALPGVGDRAFLRKQGPGAELERDLAELGIVDPMLPFL